MSKIMRAKVRCISVQAFKSPDGTTEIEEVKFSAVGPRGEYPADGSDENNTFARFTPCADMTFNIANPALFGKFSEGDEFYVDFTKSGA